MAFVLIVDDDVDLLEMVSYALKINGMTVECLDQGALLMTKVVDRKPDIILMDIYLGDSDGRDLCRILKTDPALQMIPVILYSAGHIPMETVKQSLADEFISKPFSITHLVDQITRRTAAGSSN